jgi:hypothetical protein
VNVDRLEALARALAEREKGRRHAREVARERAERLRSEVEEAIQRFGAAAASAGAPYLGHLVEVGPVEPDAKSVRAFQFTVSRGRHEGIVVSKDRGEVMLVGPFRRHQEQGPCHPVQLRDDQLAGEALEEALENFLVALIEQAFES